MLTYYPSDKELFDSLKNILNTIDEGIHVINKDGVTIFYNEVAARLDNLYPEEVLGKHFLEVFPSLTEKTSTLLKVLKTNKPIINKEQTFTNYKGEQITTINSTLPLYSAGKLFGAIEISKDITNVKKLSDQVSSLRQEIYGKPGTKKTVKNKEAKYTFEDIVATSKVMKKVISLAKKIAQTDSSVLVYGDTGTGKELIVQAIHNHSRRKDNAFISQNCAALPETLLDSILFGTVKGTFTGATDRPGLFELADGGTLFLDEINSLPLDLQAKLLRVLQEGNIRRVGDTKERSVDVRLMVAMNISPEKALEQRLLRRDLYYRINVVYLKLPLLSERKEDIEALTEHFIEKYRYKFNSDIKKVSEDVLKLFKSYGWPGNVRELENAIEGAMNLASGHIIKKEDLPYHLKQWQTFNSSMGDSFTDLPVQPLRSAVQHVEMNLIKKALKNTGGNISWAAQLLKIPRQTLQYKIKNYGLKP